MQQIAMIFGMIFCLVLTGCGSSSDSEEKGETGAGSAINVPKDATPVNGGRIIQGSIGDASNLIPLLATDSASSDITTLLYVSPLRYNKDIEIETWAAESYEVLEDGKLLRFTLRPGIMWDDGVELTAEDVEFTYKTMIDPNTPTAYAEGFLNVAEFKVTGRYTFEVRYDEVYAKSLITWMNSILPKHALEGEDLLNTKYSREPLACGPYRLKEWVSGQKIVLESRDEYFLGRPYLDQTIYRIIPDLATMFMELKAGNLDLMNLKPRQYLQQTKGEFWDNNFKKYKYLSFGYAYLGWNLRKPMFQDKRVRQALTHAIDKQEIIQGVLLGQGEPTIGPYKPGTWPYNENIQDYPYDPEKAKAMLAESGWTDTDGDGLLDKDGEPFAFTIMTNQGNDLRIKTATIIQERLKNIGIQVKIRTVEWAAFLKEFVDKGRFDALILGWTIPIDPDGYDVWHSSKAFEGGLNHTHYINPEVDELLEKGRRTLDQAERKKIYDRLQEVLHEDQPYCFLYVPYALPIVHARFQGIEPAPSGLTHNYEQWWVPTELQRAK